MFDGSDASIEMRQVEIKKLARHCEEAKPTRQSRTANHWTISLRSQ